ncbi:MAG: hypothetical protein QXT86_13590 [Archaeoglobaceae archaeon]
MSKVVLSKVKDSSKLSLWRLEIYKQDEAMGLVHVFLLELPKRLRSVEMLETALKALGHDVEIKFEISKA